MAPRLGDPLKIRVRLFRRAAANLTRTWTERTEDNIVMPWFFLIIAGVMEWGWPIGLRYAWTEDGFRSGPVLGAIASMTASGFFLLLALRGEIPMGTAYAVWTGIGAIGVFVLGIVLFDEPAQLLRIVSVALIVAGIVGLKLAA
jgi:quaternary ammonium compound-resistance protein SugE